MPNALLCSMTGNFCYNSWIFPEVVITFRVEIKERAEMFTSFCVMPLYLYQNGFFFFFSNTSDLMESKLEVAYYHFAVSCHTMTNKPFFRDSCVFDWCWEQEWSRWQDDRMTSNLQSFAKQFWAPFTLGTNDLPNKTYPDSQPPPYGV